MAQCFITRRGGGTGNLEELPNLPTNVRFVVGNGKATVTHTNPTRAYSGTYFVYKQGSTPQNINDGTKVDFGTTTSNTLTGLSNTQYYARYFPYNSKRQIQTQYNSYGFRPEAFSMPRYTGQHSINGNIRRGSITMRTSGTLTLSEGRYDIFLVGGGGGGGYNGTYGSGGGGGGKTKTVLNRSINQGNYTVTIGSGGNVGAPGGTTQVGSIISAEGGRPGSSNGTGGSGGSGGGAGGYYAFSNTENIYTGGRGGINGSNGIGTRGGVGQNTSTYEFGAQTGVLYSGGGGGGGGNIGYSPGSGGSGGGGDGSSRGNWGTVRYAENGKANTGGGGGGALYSGDSSYAGAGGSGIAIIRWGY